MNRADPDIAAVRDLPPGPIEPTDESVSRTWHTMTRKQTPPARSRFRRWVPAAAALVVAGLTATGVAILPSGGGGSSAVPVGSAPSASPPQKNSGPSGAPSPGGSPKVAPPLGPPLEVGSSKPINARQSLDRLATKVAGSPTETVRPDQFVYARVYGVNSNDNIGDDAPGKLARDEVEYWFRPEGMTPVAMTRNGAEDHGTFDPPASVDHPYIWQPTPEWLAALPTQPTALKAALLDGIGNDKWSDAHLLAKEIGELLVSSETLLPADVRVAMLKSIKTWKGLSARETVFDGKRVWAFRQTEQGQVNELLFDPATGRAVGRANGVEGKINYQVLWTHKVVGKAGER